jgi:ketosteroid isomerase-like protein
VNPDRLDELRGVYAAVNTRDLEAIAEFGRRHPSFEWTAAADEVDSDTRTGELEDLRYWRDLFATFDELTTVIEREIVLDDEHVIFAVRHHARGAASGAEADRREAHLWGLKGDRVDSLREFATVEEAREAAARG